MKILLGVCGGVAAYKAAELTRELERRGADVQVVLTAGAERFVTALTFAALSNRQVLTSLWTPATSEAAQGEPGEFAIEHIALAQQADALVIAPATANVLAKLAQGLADDLLTTIALATKAPLIVAPAMNVNMWEHPATQANLALLRERGARIVEPGAGYLACGMVGAGRLADVSEIADATIAAASSLSRTDLAGETVLITAGGTREPIDAVRFLGNRSSGKMGHALAAAAQARGANVVLVTASELPSPGCERVQVQTAAEMQAAVMAHLPRATAVVMAAAVADYRVVSPSPQKLKKQESLTLELIQNPDILREVVRAKRAGTVVVGFAAETENLLPEARRKLREKGLDAIVANDVLGAEAGFESDRNGGWFVTADEEVLLPLGSKRAMADLVLDGLVRVRSLAQSELVERDLTISY